MSEATAVAEPAEVTPQAAEATTPDSDQQEADALLAELEEGKGTPAKADGDTPGDEDTVDDEVEAAVQARAAELAEQKARELATEQEAKRKADEDKAKRKAEAEGQENAFRGRIQAIEDFCVEKGMDPADAQRVAATFRAHHGDLAPVTQRQTQRELIEAAGLEDYEWEDPASFIAAVREAAKEEHTKGHITETQHKRQLADALLAQKRRFQKNPELLTATAGASDRQPVGAAGGLTIERLRNATPEQYEQLKVQYGSEAISRVYMQAAGQ